MSKFNALVIGHSFVSKTQDFVFEHIEDTVPDCHLSDFNVDWHGRGGLKLHHLDTLIPTFLNNRYDILVLDIGTNDLSDSHVCPIQLARLVFGAAHWILTCLPTVQFIFILDIYRRACYSRYSYREDFNDATATYNAELRQQVISHGGPVHCVGLKGLDRLHGLFIS